MGISPYRMPCANSMLKINRFDSINEETIESICWYDTNPLKRLVKNAKDNGTCSTMNKQRKTKTVIIRTDGSLVACPLNPDTYLSRLDGTQYLVASPRRIILKKSMIKEITQKPSAYFRRLIRGAKKNGMFIDLSRGKKTNYYILMESGRIYGLNQIRTTIEET